MARGIDSHFDEQDSELRHEFVALRLGLIPGRR